MHASRVLLGAIRLNKVKKDDPQHISHLSHPHHTSARRLIRLLFLSTLACSDTAQPRRSYTPAGSCQPHVIGLS